ncbi:hypothetical protein [Streptomyces sp. NBC_00343]|uniref:hypothetical protein n=1 Tax=Streptomyces sp. NBC_00343 TaxID=2975719 RepID=UPI002E2E7CA0|nr:hypothetical protein [Streptomyces sp. NBC_00343]
MKKKIDSEDALWQDEPYGHHTTRTIYPGSMFYRSVRRKNAPRLGVGLIEIAALLIPELEREGYIEEQISILAEAPTAWQKIKELISALLGLREMVRELRSLASNGHVDESLVPRPVGTEIIVAKAESNRSGYVAFKIPGRSLEQDREAG